MLKRLLLIEDQCLVRASLAALINSASPFEVTHQVATVNEALNLLQKNTAIDLILCDYNLENDTAKSLLNKTNTIELPPVVLLTSAFNALEIQSCQSLGAKGFLFKESTLEQIIEALTTIVEGGQWFELPHSPAEEPNSQLTPAEHETLQWLATGMSNKQIALATGKSKETIKVYIGRILRKLDCKTRTQAVTKAVRLNLMNATKPFA